MLGSVSIVHCLYVLCHVINAEKLHFITRVCVCMCVSARARYSSSPLPVVMEEEEGASQTVSVPMAGNLSCPEGTTVKT